MSMAIKIIETNDGSHSIYVPELDEHYHSKHGAIQESEHVFVMAGLHHVIKHKSSIRILEVGFGTGLNCVLTAIDTAKAKCHIEYVGIEKYPLSYNTLKALNYSTILQAEELFAQIIEAEWGKSVAITSGFKLRKEQNDLLDCELELRQFDLVYFDAFGPRAQPEMWASLVFDKVAKAMCPGATLVTYCSKGSVRRTMEYCGLEVEKLPGPPGKREMVRATKIGS